MYFSTRTTPANPYSLPTVPLTNKSIFFQSPTIHSARTRNNVFSDGTSFGKLHKSSSKKQNRNQYEPEMVLQSFTAQNWRKNVEVNVNKEDLENGLREYLGISQPFRPKTATSKENTSLVSHRAVTSSGNRKILLGNSSMGSFRKTQVQKSGVEATLRRDLMYNPDEYEVKDFNDDTVSEKFQHVKFIKAPPKELMKLLKLSNYDVTLVPSDSRRIVVEAIMRDFFLNLIPENSDFLICKNSQSQTYTITFTGRLVPTCKVCTSATRFEISNDIGFQVLCNSQYCNLKVLYTNKLSDKVYECLWPSIKRIDVEPSLRLEGGDRTPAISKIIQSGKYKITDFSRVISESAISQAPQNGHARPSTTANIMRRSTARLKFNQVITKTCYSEKFNTENETARRNTAQGLRRPTGGRPGTSGSMEAKEFKGASVLKEFDDRGMFMKEKEEIGVIEQVSEEVSKDEEDMKEERKNKSIKTSLFISGRMTKEKKENSVKKALGHSMPLGKRNMMESQEMSNKLDNSMEEIHNMVNIMNKGK